MNLTRRNENAEVEQNRSADVSSARIERTNRTPAKQVVSDKTQWHRSVSADEHAAGLRGWHTRGYLPHFDKPGLVQSITYRLHDAMPAEKRAEWEVFMRLKDDRERYREIEHYLDRGFGSCALRRRDVANVVQESFLHGDREHYRLLAWVIMPNPVHVLIEQKSKPLDQIIKDWKSFTSHRIHQLLGSSGRLRQPDYFDRFIRNQEHFDKVVHYIENNPLKAGLVVEAAAWEWSSLSWRVSQPADAADYHPESNPLNRPDEYREK